jgi:predicted RNA binding protein YcfA (HicA-like mRNA interferase family)
MKRRALLGYLQEHGCVPVREGGSHSIWSNPQTGRKEAGSKQDKAQKLGVKVIDEAALLRPCAARRPEPSMRAFRAIRNPQNPLC